MGKCEECGETSKDYVIENKDGYKCYICGFDSTNKNKEKEENE